MREEPLPEALCTALNLGKLPGQYIHLIRDDGLARSYSIAS